MTNLLLDTNALITLALAPAGTTFSAIQPGDALAVSIVTEFEVRGGLAIAPNDPARQHTFAFLTDRYVPLPLDAKVATHFHHLAANSAALGQRPRKRIADLMIAATALAHGATLVTDDQGLIRVAAGLLPVRSLR